MPTWACVALTLELSQAPHRMHKAASAAAAPWAGSPHLDFLPLSIRRLFLRSFSLGSRAPWGVNGEAPDGCFLLSGCRGGDHAGCRPDGRDAGRCGDQACLGRLPSQRSPCLQAAAPWVAGQWSAPGPTNPAMRRGGLGGTVLSLAGQAVCQAQAQRSVDSVGHTGDLPPPRAKSTRDQGWFFRGLLPAVHSGPGPSCQHKAAPL